MNIPALQVDVASTGLEPVDEPSLRLLKRWVVRLIRWGVGTWLCQFVLGGVMVIGWTQRVVRRSVLSRWPASEAGRRTVPNEPEPVRSRLGVGGWRRIRRSASSVAGLFVAGLSSLLATWLLLAPAQILWAFSWHAGWNTSFSKVYEQSQVGSLTGLAGVALFLLAVPLLPMAQARHAVTGEWRTAIDLPALRRLVGERPWSSLGLAIGYAVTSLPLTVLVIAPVFFGQNLEGGIPEIRRLAVRYWFVVTAVGVPLFVVLRLVAGRVYSKALRSAAAHGRIDRRQLHSEETRLLALLPLAASRRSANPLVRGLVKVPVVALTAFFWFLFVAQIYVAAFFHDRGPRQWLNQPLIEIPWWRSLPEHLQLEAELGPQFEP